MSEKILLVLMILLVLFLGFGHLAYLWSVLGWGLVIIPALFIIAAIVKDL